MQCKLYVCNSVYQYVCTGRLVSGRAGRPGVQAISSLYVMHAMWYNGCALLSWCNILHSKTMKSLEFCESVSACVSEHLCMSQLAPACMRVCTNVRTNERSFVCLDGWVIG